MTRTSIQASLEVELIRLRRALHADPEVGLQLPRTQAAVIQALSGLPLEVSQGGGLSSVTAVLRGAHPGPAVLLRSDMDALPLKEQSDLEHASANGAMHACGHDLHIAMLVGAARILAERRDELHGDVVFMFQPGEEGHDGAGRMLREGVLESAGEPVVAAYGLHVMASRFPHGVFVSRPGPLMAGGDLLKVTLRGQGGHGSAPHLTRDPIPAACALVTALRSVVADTVDPHDAAVLTIGSIHAGSAGNIIPEDAVIEGSLRWFSTAARDALRERFTALCHGIAQAHRVIAEPEIVEYVPATVNDPGEAALAAEVVRATLGEHRWQLLQEPVMAGEDFSRVLNRVPGAFIFLGAIPPTGDAHTAADNHSHHAVFDDAVLADGALVLAELALHRLGLQSAT